MAYKFRLIRVQATQRMITVRFFSDAVTEQDIANHGKNTEYEIYVPEGTTTLPQLKTLVFASCPKLELDKWADLKTNPAKQNLDALLQYVGQEVTE